MGDWLLVLLLQLKLDSPLCTDHNLVLELVDFLDVEIFLRGLRYALTESRLQHLVIPNYQ